MIANALTVGRMLFSVLLLLLPPDSAAFTMFYLLCGVTDVLDGFAARRLHTESDRGARLDSAADLLFAAVAAVRILPRLPLPLWIWSWTAGIALAKLTGMLVRHRRGRLMLGHTLFNRLTGLACFLLPLTVGFVNVGIGAALVCALATCAVLDENIAHPAGSP